MLSSLANAQTPLPIEDGYYTIGSLTQEKDKYLYSYDTDALRNIYGNAADYDNPFGKNGEFAYLYSTEAITVNQANKAYYFEAQDDGSYIIQSCSGEAYSYLNVANYDRRLVIHSPRPQKHFYLRDLDQTDSWEENEYIMQQMKDAVLFDSLAAMAHGVDNLQVLTPLNSELITPAFTIRRALGYARGALAIFPSGDNPGQVSPMLSSTLKDCIEEAQTLAENKATTLEQAEDIIQRLQSATQTYEEAAPTALNPLTSGYYWLRNAYRAYFLRQNKEKVMRVEDVDGKQILRWNNANINDGTTAFRITQSGENMAMQDYKGRWAGSPSTEDGTISFTENYEGSSQLFRYDTNGMFTIADAASPDDFFSSNSSIGEKGLYGKPTDGEIVAKSGNYIYPGYCSSWYLEHAYHQVTTPTSGWAIMSVSFPAEVPEGVEVFSVSEKEGTLYLVPYLKPVIPARTAVVLRAARGTYTFWSTLQDAEPIENNLLIANCEDRSDIVSGSMALLKVKNGQVGFQKSTLKKLAAGSAYIPFSEGQEEFRTLQFIETGIETVKTTQEETAYDLSGKKVSKTNASGIIIVNNKKLLKR